MTSPPCTSKGSLLPAHCRYLRLWSYASFPYPPLCLPPLTPRLLAPLLCSVFRGSLPACREFSCFPLPARLTAAHLFRRKPTRPPFSGPARSHYSPSPSWGTLEAFAPPPSFGEPGSLYLEIVPPSFFHPPSPFPGDDFVPGSLFPLSHMPAFSLSTGDFL